MRVLIADDHSVLREGVKAIVRSIKSNASIDEATNGRQALSKAKGNGYDLLILDISMPGLSGLDVLQSLKDMGLECRSMILSLYPEEVYAGRAFKLGSVGYVSKCAPYDEIKHAIQKVINGGRYVSPGLAEKMVFDELVASLPHDHLSEREFQVMIHLAHGRSLSEIADQICISDKTVSTYRSRIMKKMNMNNNAELTYYAIKNKLIS